LIGLLGRIAGPKVLLGVLVAAGLAIGWLWFSYSNAAANAAQSEANADNALEAAANNAKAAREARHQAEKLASTLQDRQQREKDLRAELSQTHNQLEEARSNASEKVRDCLSVRLGSSFIDGLRAEARGDGGGNAKDSAASSSD